MRFSEFSRLWNRVGCARRTIARLRDPGPTEVLVPATSCRITGSRPRWAAAAFGTTVYRARDTVLDRIGGGQGVQTGPPERPAPRWRSPRCRGRGSPERVYRLRRGRQRGRVVHRDGVRRRPALEHRGIDGKVHARGPGDWRRPADRAGFGRGHAGRGSHGDLEAGERASDRGRMAKITDFGLSRRVAGSRTPPRPWSGGERPREISGTPSYMSPEQSRGGRYRRDDVFSFGVVLYEMVTEPDRVQSPSVLQVLHQIARGPAATLPTCPSRLLESCGPHWRATRKTAASPCARSRRCWFEAACGLAVA